MMTHTELKAHRKTLGLTQGELAALLGCTQNTVSAWEQAPPKGNPVPALVARLVTQWVQAPKSLRAWRRTLNNSMI